MSTEPPDSRLVDRIGAALAAVGIVGHPAAAAVVAAAVWDWLDEGDEAGQPAPPFRCPVRYVTVSGADTQCELDAGHAGPHARVTVDTTPNEPAGLDVRKWTSWYGPDWADTECSRWSECRLDPTCGLYAGCSTSEPARCQEPIAGGLCLYPLPCPHHPTVAGPAGDDAGTVPAPDTPEGR